ncbi:MAG: alpha-L-arabinofuranosidase C-terminal domain-containing protein [Planctomycetia bacterium]|nr:alpha-L-arabinofuranosidase C-terminal domain-containing protein [Planctomycetia bacterium]
MTIYKRFILALCYTLALAGGLTRAQETTVVIDATSQTEPISPYIYGQFIEHLGRCIYGGIWAEMLQDRKFYDAPALGVWSLVGEAKFAHEKEGAFVGKASPKWNSDNDDVFGVEQANLQFVEGRDYVGYIWTKTQENQKIVVRLTYGNGANTQEVALGEPSEKDELGYVKRAFTFRAKTGTDGKVFGSLAILFTGKGEARLGTVSLMPADNIDGMRRDTLTLLRELNAPIYRWPGGNFVSGYNWRDGIGPRDKRPPRKNPAWQGIEHNDFGIDEFMLFCKHIQTEPDIAVNTGSGQVDSALAELQYVNGAADTPEGKNRAKNGHAEPYAVRYWCIGNEMFGNWQIGHMPTEQYALKNNEFVDAFRQADPNVRLICVGDVGKWDEVILRECAEHIDVLSEHIYTQEKGDVVEHVRLLANRIRQVADAHRKYRQDIPQLKGKDIRIAMDEWNYWYGPHVFGELGTRYFVKDGLGVAVGLHEYYRNSDIYEMANYAQTVNVIGCIKTSQTGAQFETTGLVLKLYRNHFGVQPLMVEAKAPYDVAAALTQDGKTLTLAIVNPTEQEASFNFQVNGLQLAKGATKYEIIGKNAMDYNDPDQPQKIDIAQTQTDDDLDKGVKVAPLSVTLFEIAVK